MRAALLLHRGPAQRAGQERRRDGDPHRAGRPTPRSTAQVDELRDAEQAEEDRAADAELRDRAQRAAADQGRASRSSRCARPARVRSRPSARWRPSLPEAVRRGRGERWIEGVFGLHARHVGNAVGYDSIVASGDHACTLHWIRNDGDLRRGRPAAAGRRHRARHPLHRRRHPHPAGQRSVQRRPARGVRGGAGGPAGRHRRRPGRARSSPTCTRRPSP